MRQRDMKQTNFVEKMVSTDLLATGCHKSSICNFTLSAKYSKTKHNKIGMPVLESIFWRKVKKSKALKYVMFLRYTYYRLSIFL